MMNRTITITFGDQAENHVGMLKIGELAKEGFNYTDLKLAEEKFTALGYLCEIINLSEYIDQPSNEAFVLIVREGGDAILSEFGANSRDVFDEQIELDWDTKAKMRGKVVNKHARHNLCYGNDSQEPDYENGQGRIIAFENIPCTNFVRENLHTYFGEKAKNLVAEGNLYHNITSCGIGFHGDTERKKVIALRLGESMSIHFQWFLNTQPIGRRFKIKLNHGDVYVMSEYATGNNWKKRLIPTLRHAAGCSFYTTITSKKPK